jgi:hypothetical protein
MEQKGAAVAMEWHIKHVSMTTNKQAATGNGRSHLEVGESRVALLEATTKQ